MKKPISIFIFLCLLLCLFVSCSDYAANKPPETERNQIVTEQNLSETETDAPETAPVVLELTAAEEETITVTESRTISVSRTPVGNDISSVNFHAPIDSGLGWFSSRFGWRSWGGTPYRPNFDNHRGMDLRAAEGTPIKSVCDVSPTEFYSNWDNSMGYHVIVTDNESGRTITYMHMIELFGTTGETAVVKGEIIGKVGNTGTSEGNHLHIEIYDRGTWRYHDPKLYFPSY